MNPSVFHSLLMRQLRKAAIVTDQEDPRIQKFIALVDEAYKDFDTDRKLLEHAIEISSKEMSEANQKLRNLADDAQKAVKFKSNFLANMSHEIRTPINGILGICEMLRERISEAESINLVELLSRSSKGLLTIINDVLDISKIEAGKLNIIPRATNIRSLVADLSTLYSAAARERGLELATNIAETIPFEINIDDGRVRQILTNLIGNAVKFTPDHGGIIVIVDLYQLADGKPGLRFSVADSGIGIPKDFLKTIFDAFSQVNSSVSRRFGGTGLGLTITQRLVDIMGGQIDVRSREGVGSLFQVTLPFEPTRRIHNIESHLRTDPSSGDELDRSKVRILLAEDNIINQKVAQHALAKLGFHTVLASNGKQALDLCREQEFDIILMDCQMPEMSGFEATTLIRKLPGREMVPVIALTALAMEGDREKCLDSGMTDYISKPFKREELETMILRWLQALPPSGSP